MQKIKKVVASCVLIGALSWWFVACKSAPLITPVVNPQTGVTNYIESPQLSNTLAAIQGFIQQVPNTGFAPVDVAKDVGLSALALFGTVISIIAKAKSTTANNHAAAADVLAGVVTSNNLSQQALMNAGAAASTVAQHIDNNTISKT